MNTKTLHWLKSVDSLFRSPDHKVKRWFSAFVLLLLWLSIEGFFALLFSQGDTHHLLHSTPFRVIGGLGLVALLLIPYQVTCYFWRRRP
jgi:hypothetical protein